MQVGNNFPEININTWVNLLENATQSQKNEHKYIVLSDKNFALGSKLNTFAKKLSIEQIVTISKNKIEEAAKAYEKGGINEKEFSELSGRIAAYTEKLIEAREIKWNQPFKRFARGVALITSLISIIGIPIFLKLKQTTKKFEDEIRDWKAAMGSAKDQASEMERESMNIEQRIKRIPYILEELTSSVKDKDRVNSLKSGILKDIESTKESDYTEQFYKDMNRGEAFIRKDKLLGIEDNTPMPSEEIKGKERIKEGKNLIQKMTEREKDKPWELILQSVVTQTSLNNIFDGAIMLFNIEGGLWSVNRNDYSLKAVFSEHHPPIILNIIRNPETKEIEQVNVEVKGDLNIIRYMTNTNQNLDTVFPGAIKGELKYSITLDENKKPIFNITHVKLEPHHELTIEKKMGCSNHTAKKIAETIEKIPNWIEKELNTEEYKETLSSAIGDILLKQWRTLQEDERPEIFDEDFGRHQSFQLGDKVYPDSGLKGQKRAEESATVIKQILKTNADKQWEPILQLAVTQTSVNGAFHGPIGHLTDWGSKIFWKSQGQQFALLPEFSEETKPIKLDIVRNPITQDIEKVQVRVIGALDMVGEDLESSALNDEGELTKTTIKLTPDALKAELTYTITLDEKGEPIISELQCHYSTSVTP